MNYLSSSPEQTEWVIVAPDRQKRPWKPTNECPFCDGSPDVEGLNMPAIIENKFPALEPSSNSQEEDYQHADNTEHATETIDQNDGQSKKPAEGVCKVILWSKSHDIGIEDLSPENVVETWDLVFDYIQSFHKSKKIQCWLPFENCGDFFGASLKHPHAQLYGITWEPWIRKQRHKKLNEFKRRHGSCYHCQQLNKTKANTLSLFSGLIRGKKCTTYAPFSPKWPIQLETTPHRHVQSWHELTFEEKNEMARQIISVRKRLLSTFGNNLDLLTHFELPLASDDPSAHHFRILLISPNIIPGRKKILGGLETLTGIFINSRDAKAVVDYLSKNSNDNDNDKRK